MPHASHTLSDTEAAWAAMPPYELYSEDGRRFSIVDWQMDMPLEGPAAAHAKMYVTLPEPRRKPSRREFVKQFKPERRVDLSHRGLSGRQLVNPEEIGFGGSPECPEEYDEPCGCDSCIEYAQ